MPTGDSQTLLSRVARRLGQPPSYADDTREGSILALAASSYGAHEPGRQTWPTGFDPGFAVLFEALVESAFLVANADGDFDATERAAFQHVVFAVCGDAVPERQIRALVADLEDMLMEDGLDKRLRMVARAAVRPDQAQEVVRVAALLAHVSGGLSPVEREVLGKLVSELRLGPEALEQALREAELALSE